jgi:hypothetical protein
MHPRRSAPKMGQACISQEDGGQTSLERVVRDLRLNRNYSSHHECNARSRLHASIYTGRRDATVVSKKSEVGLVHFRTLLQLCTFYVLSKSIQNCARPKITHSLVITIKLILQQGAPLLFNDGKHNLLVFPCDQCCRSELALTTLCYLFTLQLHSIILTDCFLFSLALLSDLVVSQVAVDDIHEPVYLVQFFYRILHEVVESTKVS